MTDLSKAVTVTTETKVDIEWWELGRLFAGASSDEQGMFLHGAALEFDGFHAIMQYSHIGTWIRGNVADRTEDIQKMLEDLAEMIGE